MTEDQQTPSPRRRVSLASWMLFVAAAVVVLWGPWSDHDSALLWEVLGFVAIALAAAGSLAAWLTHDLRYRDGALLGLLFGVGTVLLLVFWSVAQNPPGDGGY